MKRSLLFLAGLLLVGACAQSRESQSRSDQVLGKLSRHLAQVTAKANLDHSPENAAYLQKLEEKLVSKRLAGGLANSNNRLMQQAMDGHTKIYPLAGQYRVLVIPVQFADVKFSDPGFYSQGKSGGVPAQEYLFGEHKDSMTSFYRHESMGMLNVTGEIAPIVTVDGNMVDYGEATAQSSDIDARGLVVQTLSKLMQQKSNPQWWASFDRWDLQDYDDDQHFYEPDGFVDAVILIYAGKDQASCQRSFDPEGQRPASAEVPAGPRHDAAVECFNRIWPHRWSIALSKDDPLYSESGPTVEGFERPSFNGLKVNDELFALDYNMQSEFSDRSTFFHEFGHSLSLPDIYASSGENSTGSWELMSSNANLQAQEFSSYSRMSLGWLRPRIFRQGQNGSAYLGANNFVTETQRRQGPTFEGPTVVTEPFLEDLHQYDIVSEVPDTGESVYRSLMTITEPTEEWNRVADTDPGVHGHISAYSGRFDGDLRALKVRLTVPATEHPELSFDALYHIETETNFDSKDPEIKVVTDYDIGAVVIDGKTVEELRTVSGDSNFDTLAEANPACEAPRVLELRIKGISEELSEEEKQEWAAKKEICQQPVWIKKTYDLSDQAGKEIELEIRYTTDAGYTEIGIVVDNIKIGDQIFDFESGQNLGEFKKLQDGQVEARFQQFYLLEYRNVGESYTGSDGTQLSWNMDNHINAGGQSFFLDVEGSLLDRFRMVKMEYQPGVLVWYFNSKYSRSENSASKQDGKGYLLVLNSDPKEVKLPGVFSDPKWFNEQGEYRAEDADLKAYVEDQKKLFVCVSHTAYAAYITGESPECDEATKDALQEVTLNGKKLRYRREWFNEIKPQERYGFQDVGEPFRSDAGIRTALSTFRPKTSESFKPFSVYKFVEGQMVLDEELTASSLSVEPRDQFSDKNQQPLSKRLKGDSVLVEKKNFSFKVAAPSGRVVSQYSKEADPDTNDHFHRRPLAKVYLNWN